MFKKFGDVITDAESTAHRGTSVSAAFVGANPRNNLRQEHSYAIVERLTVHENEADLETSHTEAGQELARDKSTSFSAEVKRWNPVRDDGDWHLVFQWHRTSELLATSEVTITWDIEEWTEPGIYRLRYYGDAKSIRGVITGFEGVSSEFQVI